MEIMNIVVTFHGFQAWELFYHSEVFDKKILDELKHNATALIAQIMCTIKNITNLLHQRICLVHGLSMFHKISSRNNTSGLPSLNLQSLTI